MLVPSTAEAWRGNIEAFRVRLRALGWIEKTRISSSTFAMPITRTIGFPRSRPSLSQFRSCSKRGGLLCYGPLHDERFRQMAVYVDRILRGAKPADLPIERPTKFELVVNLKTARALGLPIPQSLLLQANDAYTVSREVATQVA